MTSILVILLQEVYAREGIEWSNVEFDNNNAVLSLYNEVRRWDCRQCTLLQCCYYSLKGCGIVLMEILTMILLLW